jgi:hypothetical protein
VGVSVANGAERAIGSETYGNVLAMGSSAPNRQLPVVVLRQLLRLEVCFAAEEAVGFVAEDVEGLGLDFGDKHEGELDEREGLRFGEDDFDREPERVEKEGGSDKVVLEIMLEADPNAEDNLFEDGEGLAEDRVTGLPGLDGLLDVDVFLPSPSFSPALSLSPFFFLSGDPTVVPDFDLVLGRFAFICLVFSSSSVSKSCEIFSTGTDAAVLLPSFSNGFFSTTVHLSPFPVPALSMLTLFMLPKLGALFKVPACLAIENEPARLNDVRRVFSVSRSEDIDAVRFKKGAGELSEVVEIEVRDRERGRRVGNWRD